MKKVIVFLLFFVGGLWVINSFNYKSNTKENTKTTEATIVYKSPEELRKEQIESQFSKWDGSHPKVVDEIKKQMKNPKSYEHIKTVYFDREKVDNMIKVVCEFRGANTFNAMIKSTAEAIIDMDGNIKSFTMY